ncbi:type III secretion system gatekeeper subunit SctW, partial [Aquabacterium sp.]|uniref:type III secretion system gatekeeper subunit SctW n=1 Tax=Aquabacterium sp. TaxID=1872578 RepID=UPI002C6F1746
MNEMRIHSPQPQPASGRPADAASARGNESGRFRGEIVQLLTAQDAGPSTDAAEEMSMHFAESVEEEAFDQESIEARDDLQVMSAEQVMGYLRAAHQGAEADKLVAQAKRLVESSGHPGVMARQGFPDPTQQFLALQYALQQGQRDGAPADRLQALRDALADLDDDHGAQIRTRLNTVAVIGAQGTDSAAVAELQQTYEDLVLGAPTLAKTLDLALARFGSQAYASGLKMLVAALGADLAAARPSTSMVRLQSLLQDLYQLEVVQTVLDGADELSRALAQRHGHEGLDAQALVRELVSLTTERWVNSARFESWAGLLGVPEGP